MLKGPCVRPFLPSTRLPADASEDPVRRLARSRMPTKEELFLEKPLSGDLHEVPGLGDAGIRKLNEAGYATTYQLIGKFLLLNRNEEDFLAFLHKQGNTRPHVDNTARCINKRVTEKGFACHIRLSDHVVKTAANMFDDTKKTAFLEKTLRGLSLSEAFHGIRDETRFRAKGIKTPDHLFGEFLMILNHPDPTENTSKCDEFYALLKSLGAANGHKSVIIYQLQAKLAVGIDTHGKEALKLKHELPVLREVSRETLCEEDFDDLQEEAPPTGAGSRTGRPSVGANVTPKKLDLSDAKPKDEAGRTCISGGKLIVAVGLLAVLAYFLLADEEGQLMLPEPGRAPALPGP